MANTMVAIFFANSVQKVGNLGVLLHGSALRA